MSNKMGLSPSRKDRFKKKLQLMASSFPDVDLMDLERLNDLVAYDDVRVMLQKVFLYEIDAGRYLEVLIDICLEYSYANLADVLIKYCLDNQVITDAEGQKGFVRKIISAVTRFGLSKYVDIERQSSQVQFSTWANRFTLNLKRIPVTEQLAILKLLRDIYAQRLLNKSLAENPNLQALYIERYNNLTGLIRNMDHVHLEERRWTRLYAVENLEYGPNTSSVLFQRLSGDCSPGPATFDELLWKHFSIMLFPALGSVRFDYGKVIVSNEGQGCIQDPDLEIRYDEELIAKVSTSTIVLAHESVVFHLEERDLQVINGLDPNRELAMHLVFSKFGHTPFKFVRRHQVGEVQESLISIPSQEKIAKAAEKLGISPDRIWALAERQVSSDRELFQRVKELIVAIRRYVEQDDGHRLLTDCHGEVRAPKSENDIQVAFKIWLRPLCQAMNIDMNREALTGRGELDFKFSVGNDLKCLVEVKLFHSTRLGHGLEIQLPTYLISENAQFGIYVPIIFDPSLDESELAQLQEKATNLSQTNDFEIDVVDIRAWKPTSASKAHQLDDPARYDV